MWEENPSSNILKHQENQKTLKTLRPAFLPMHSVVCADELSSPKFERLRDADCRLRDPDCRLRPPNDGFRSLASPFCRLRSSAVSAWVTEVSAWELSSAPTDCRLRSRRLRTVVSATAYRRLCLQSASPQQPTQTVVSAAKPSSPIFGVCADCRFRKLSFATVTYKNLNTSSRLLFAGRLVGFCALCPSHCRVFVLNA